MEDSLIGVENDFSITLMYLGRRDKPVKSSQGLIVPNQSMVLSLEGLRSVYVLSDSRMPLTHHSPTHNHHQLAGDSRWESSQGLGLPVYVTSRLKWISLCMCVHRFYFIFLNLFIHYLFLAALGLRCCTQAFSSCGERGLLFIAVRGLLIVVASLIAECRL